MSEEEGKGIKNSIIKASSSEVEIVMCTVHTHKINLHLTIALQCSPDLDLSNLC